MKLRYFYKINHKKEPVLGSNVKRKSRPKPYSQWKEITPLCCNPDEISCICGPRFWVQMDGYNKPVDGSLIKRNDYPNMSDGVKYQEITWKSPCCADTPFKITWDFTVLNSTTGSLIIMENGVERVNETLNSSGEFIPAPDALIEIFITNECEDTVVTACTITGGYVFEELDGGASFNHNFLFTVTSDVNISSSIDCIGR